MFEACDPYKNLISFFDLQIVPWQVSITEEKSAQSTSYRVEISSLKLTLKERKEKNKR